jgi:hypothetical protein
VFSTRYLRRILAPSLVAALATVTACGGDDGPSGPTPAITVAVAPPAITAVQGETKTATVTITRTNFTGPVNLVLENAAAAAAASDPASAVAKVAENVIVAQQGVPEGVTGAFAPATLSGTTLSSTLTVTVAGSVAAGTYNLRVRAQGEGVTAKTAPLTLTVTAAPTPTIGLTLTPAALSVAQGASSTSQVAITRAGGFAGAVNLAATGQPEGVTVTIDPASAPAGTAAATITVAVGAAVPTGDYPITITGTGEGVENAVATLTLTVTAPVTGNYTLAVAPNPVNVQAGATATATVNITRTGGFAGNVGLAVSGAPAGLTVTVDPASAPGNTAALTITAAANLAAGDYPITVTGTAAGLADQQATFTVHVTAGGGGTLVSVAYCPDDIPLWLAVQDGDGAFTRVTPTGAGNNTFTFNLASGRGGVAAVTQNGDDDFDLSVFYATTAEFTAAAGAGSAQLCGDVGTGTKVVNGSVANVGATELAIVSLGGSTAFVIPGGSTNFTLEHVDEGSLDLIATRLTQEFVANKLIIRRGLNVANGGTLDVLDFNAAEAFDPASADVTITGLGTDEASIGASFVGSGASSFLGTTLFFDQQSTEDQRTYFGVPTDKQAAGELNALFVSAAPPGDNPDRGRFVYTFFKSVEPRTLALGADLPAPTVTSAATTPYLQLRVQFTAPAEYNQLVDVTFSQANRSAEISMTAAYAATADYDLVIPDLSGVEGFDNDWGLQSVATDWDVSAIGGNFLFGFLGQGPADGSTALFASRSGSIGGAAHAARAIPAGPTVAGMRALRSAQALQATKARQRVLR